MDRTYYLCAAWRSEFVRIIPQLYSHAEEAWSVCCREKLHLLKVLPSDTGGWLFDEYLDHPDVPGTGAVTILMALASLDRTVRDCLMIKRPKAPARC